MKLRLNAFLINYATRVPHATSAVAAEAETVATVVKMQQEIFKFVKRAAFPMHATIPQSPVPIPIPSTNPPLPSSPRSLCDPRLATHVLICVEHN